MPKVAIEQEEYDVLREIARLLFATNPIEENDPDDREFKEAARTKAFEHFGQFGGSLPDTLDPVPFSSTLAHLGAAAEGDRANIDRAADVAGISHKSADHFLSALSMFYNSNEDDDIAQQSERLCRSLNNLGFNGPRHGGMQRSQADLILQAAAHIQMLIRRREDA